MLLDDFYHERFHTVQTPKPTGKPLLDFDSDAQRDPARSVRKSRPERRPGGGRQQPYSGGRSEGQPVPSSEGSQPAPSNPPGEGRPPRRRRGGRGRSRPSGPAE
jgi:hypothetical protein